MPSTLIRKVLKAAETLEALAFFIQDLNKDLVSNLQHLRANVDHMARSDCQGVLGSLKKDIRYLRKQSGAMAPDSAFCSLLEFVRTQHQYVYIPKWYIDQQLFGNYDSLFKRWPHVKEHALVVFDGKSNQTLGQIYEIEGALYDDVLLLLRNARALHEGTDDFRKRKADTQRALLTHLRATTLALFTLLEAYLNGLAFDCFLVFHDELPIQDHDVLAEWSSQEQRPRFVAFDRKLFKYPSIVGKAHDRTVDLSSCKPAHKIANEGKQMRDALIHPSPYPDPRVQEPIKLPLFMKLNLSFIEDLFDASREYIETVERAIGKNPSESVPWLYEE